MTNSRYQSFKPETFKFLGELAKNNNRDWFNQNKTRYEEDVLDVALRFIQSMQEPLESIAPNFTAVPKRMGGSLMRVYRDTRFSKNKTPYKTNVGIQFRHERAKDVHSPGFYVHIDPEQVFIGAGMWRPASPALAGIRERITDKPEDWLRVSTDKRFTRHFHLGGVALTRPPRGYAKDHPLIEDIKRKDFIAIRNMNLDDALDAKFQQKVETSFKAAADYMQFLCKAVGVVF